MKRWYVCLLPVFLFFVLCGGCAGKDDMEKLRDAEFTVVSPEEMPEELDSLIGENKKEEFQLTYADKGYLYIARGYGERETSGYSVEVSACYETKDAICMETELLGPPKDEEILEKSTCPYVVIKTEYVDKHVVFK